MLLAKPDCATKGGTLCRPVWELTHSDWLAKAVDTVTSHGARIVLIIVVALIVRFILHRMIRRITRVTAEGTVPPALRPLKERTANLRLFEGSALASERRRQRSESIGSIMRSTTSFITATVAAILVLGELGIDVAPIIASAGIAGVALGFGAQNLVRDFLSGMFMILEDQFGVGDVIDIGPAIGTVEAVGLRTTQLRDESGTVWYVRNGEVIRVANRSQGDTRLILDITVDKAVATDRATRLVTETADSMWHDEAWRPSILAAPNVLGIENLTADGYVLRLAITTRAEAHTAVAREMRARLVGRFDAEGIPVPATVGP